MPMLFAALTATSDRLFGSERLLAFLDNLYVVTTPERTVEVHNVLLERVVETCQNTRAPREDTHLESRFHP